MPRAGLAYVFWHAPAGGEDAAAYEAALLAFHAALACPGSGSLALARTPWTAHGGPWYEDWYPVAGWAALGELNRAAVDAGRRSAHDAVARRAADGAGGVYARLHGDAPVAHVRHALWLAKPPGHPYAAFHEELIAALPAGAAVWQRQLVLGPAPECAVLSPEPLMLPWPAVATAPRPVAPA